MYKSFEVRNFRGIKSAVLPDMARVNLITGLNDAGKTSVLEAMFLHASGPLAGTMAVQTLRGGRGQPFEFGPNVRSPWDDLFHNLDVSSSVVLSGTTDQGKYQVKLDAGSDEALKPVQLGPGVNPSGDNRSTPDTSLKITEVRGSGAATTYIQSIETRITPGPTPNDPASFSVNMKLEPPEARPYTLAAMVGGRLGSDLAAGYSDIRRRHTSIDLVQALRDIDDRITSLEVLVNNGRSELFATVNGSLMPFELLGDGPRSIAQYLVSMASAKGGLLLIDEFGTGVHHSLYPRIWKVLHRAAERLDVQIVATTHSAECLFGAFESLGSRPNQLNLYRLRRSDEHAGTDVRRYWGEKLQAAVEMNAELR